MIGNPIDKGKAERLAELLAATEGGRRRHKRTSREDDLAPLVEVGHALRNAAPSTLASTRPDPAFQAALRRRLLAEATVNGIGATAVSPDSERPLRRPVRSRRRFIIAAALAGIILGLSGVATASGDAVPGDALYQVKRSTERAQLALAGSDVNRGQLHFEFARIRLEEAGLVSKDAQALATALSDMDYDVTEGMRSLATAAVARQDPGILDTIDDFTAEQRPRLVSLMEELGPLSRAEAAESLTLLDSVSERSVGLRNSLLCTATAGDTADALGPLPGQCSALPGTGQGESLSPDSPPKSSRDQRDDPSGAASAGTDPSDPESSGASPSPSGPTPSDTPGDGPSEDDEEDGGLLSDLGDLLSGILG